MTWARQRVQKTSKNKPESEETRSDLKTLIRFKKLETHESKKKSSIVLQLINFPKPSIPHDDRLATIHKKNI
jgi:hypothetical protein